MTVEAHPRRRWIALGVVCLGITMNILDQSIVNVALPTIQRDLHFSQANLAWVIDAYLLTFAGLLLLAGRLGDLIGRKKIFLGGVLLFTVSSFLCGIGSSQAMLVAARFAQGAGAAFSTSVVLAIIVSEFPESTERAKAMSIYILIAVGGGSLGLLLGGVLTQGINWHWIFFINIPIGVITFVSGVFLLDENVGLGIRVGLDVGGAVLSTAGMMLTVYAIVTSATYGWHSEHTAIFGAAAAVVLSGFFVLESRLRTPMMPLRVLRSRGLGSTSLARSFMVLGLYGTFFLGVLYMQRVLGFGPLTTGLGYLPQTTAVAVMSLGVTVRLARVFTPKWTALIGFGFLLVGLSLFTTATPTTSYFPQLFFGLLLIGVGGACAFTPLLTIALAEIPPADAGLGSGLVNVSQQVSAALAVALLGVIASNRTASLLRAGSSTVHALSAGYRLGFVVSVIGVVLGAVVCIVLVPALTHPAEPDLAAVVESIEF